MGSGVAIFKNAVAISHWIISRVVECSDTLVDATCGNGHDTLFLARLATMGRVYALDIAEEAIANAATLISAHGFEERVSFHQCSFTQMDEVVKQPVKAIMFNLGFLPGSGKKYATRAEDTVVAVRKALSLLIPGGVMTVVYYTGHEGGREEAAALSQLAESLPQKEFEVLSISFINQENDPPGLIAVSRLMEG